MLIKDPGWNGLCSTEEAQSSIKVIEIELEKTLKICSNLTTEQE